MTSASGKEVKKEDDNVSGRDIMLQYIKGDPVAIMTYRKICAAFDMLEKLAEPAVRQFISQFLDVGDLLDDTCGTLVKRITTLKWPLVPLDLRDRFRNLLCEIGIRQVAHLETIYECAFINLYPTLKENENGELVPVLTEQQQDDQFTMAHSIIAQLLISIPASSKLAVKQLCKTFPNHWLPAAKYVVYFKNAINIGEYGEQIRTELWKTLIDGLVHLDNLVAKQNEPSGVRIFLMEEEDAKKEADVEKMEEKTEEGAATAAELLIVQQRRERLEKLDACILAIANYLRASHGEQIEESEIAWAHVSGSINKELCTSLMDAFEKHLLVTSNVHYVSFLWMLLGHLTEENCDRILAHLWDLVTRPHVVGGEARRAHGAAAYLAAMIARAKHIDIKKAQVWLEKMCAYLVSYADRVSSASKIVIIGQPQHGLFYALANSFFLAFCFRYRELVKAGALDDVRRWSIGRLVHCSLEPLRYSVEAVARCFAAVSRSLQLVYCTHVLPLAHNDIRRPFEPIYPFDSYDLEKSSELMSRLVRRFSPLAEDAMVLKREIHGVTVAQDEEDEDAIDFMQAVEDDMYMSVSVPIGMPIPAKNGVFTVYSTSPGLRPFHGSPMELI